VWPTTSAPRATGASSTRAPVGEGARPPRRWFAVAALVLAAALLGGVIGGLVTRGSQTPGATVTIEQGGQRPGALLTASGASIPNLVRRVAPAVVSINVSTQSGGDQGSGMIITPSGLVVTNNHVIAAAAAGGGVVTVTRTGTSTPMLASLLGADPTHDVALLQILHASGLPHVTFGNSRQLVVGDGVVAIGNALGLAAGTPTVTQGIVSALGRTVTASDAISNATETLHDMIQTDAAINPGNSGGPLIDSNGLVVGMNTAVAGSAPDGSSSQNIGFAIPAATIESLLSSLDHAGVAPPARGGAYLGVEIRTVTPALALSEHLPVTSGALVLQAFPGSGAAAAGLQAGDVIVEVNGTTIATNAGVTAVLSKITPGATIPVVVARGDRRVTLQVTTTHVPAA
jgi:S1-C subfamily serine protease